MFTIETHQDSLELWHATITDADDNSLASAPSIQSNDYGFNTKEQAEKAAAKIVAKYEKSYEPTEN